MHEAILPANFDETLAKYASDEAYQQSYLNIVNIFRILFLECIKIVCKDCTSISISISFTITSIFQLTSVSDLSTYVISRYHMSIDLLLVFKCHFPCVERIFSSVQWE